MKEREEGEDAADDCSLAVVLLVVEDGAEDGLADLVVASTHIDEILCCSSLVEEHWAV